MEKEKQIDQTIIEAVAVLSETFAPARDIADAAKRYTSNEVAAAIFRLTGTNTPIEIVYEVMKGDGYRYIIDETSTAIKYVWLLKYRI